jgi:hypothetical protein
MWTALIWLRVWTSNEKFYVVLNLPVPQNGNFLAGLAIVTCSRGTLLHRLLVTFYSHTFNNKFFFRLKQ